MNFTNLSNLSKYLLNKTVEQTSFFHHSKYFVHWIENSSTQANLRIGKYEPGLFGTTLFANAKPVGGIDLIVNKKSNTVEILWWMVNDNNFVKLMESPMYGEPIDNSEADEIKSILFAYAEKYTKENSCKILKRDVHYNLREFNTDINKFGFVLTGKKADDNPAWLVTTKLVSN